MPSHYTLTSLFGDIADSIRAKTGSQQQIVADDFPSEIANIPTGITPTGNINITDTSQVDVTNYATAQVVDSNLTAQNIRNGVTVLGITGSLSPGITPSGTINITDTSATDVTNYAVAQVSDANLVAGNIKSGTAILGITGTYEGSGIVPLPGHESPKYVTETFQTGSGPSSQLMLYFNTVEMNAVTGRNAGGSTASYYSYISVASDGTLSVGRLKNYLKYINNSIQSDSSKSYNLQYLLDRVDFYKFIKPGTFAGAWAGPRMAVIDDQFTTLYTNTQLGSIATWLNNNFSTIQNKWISIVGAGSGTSISETTYLTYTPTT